jgi:DNA-directed RNA polymerase subunit beta
VTLEHCRQEQGRKEEGVQAHDTPAHKRLLCVLPASISNVGDKVKRGDVLANTHQLIMDRSHSDRTRLLHSCQWNGANYEDAIIISERLVKDSKFATIHLDELEVSVRDTKLGPEVTTPDIPNVSELKLRNLDEEGIIRVGAEVRPGDILVGKVTPKGETQLTPEERLLRSIFGEKAKDVKDTSLRLKQESVVASLA